MDSDLPALLAQAPVSLRGRLSALSEEDLAPPILDPRLSALLGDMVVTFARSGRGAGRFRERAAEGRFDLQAIDDLAWLSKTLHSLALPEVDLNVQVSADLLHKAIEQREAALSYAYAHFTQDPLIVAKLNLLGGDTTAAAVAADLRFFSVFFHTQESMVDSSQRNHVSTLCKECKQLGEQLDRSLLGDAPPDSLNRRAMLFRVWALFEQTYSTVCRTGRDIFQDVASEQQFPELTTIAQFDRQRRSAHPSSHRASHLPTSAPQPRNTRSSTPTITAPAPSNVTAASAPPSHDTDDEPPVSRRRAFARHKVELELSLWSESNLYVGFTENISVSGVFIVTYAPRPVGALVDLTLSIPLKDGTHTISLEGEVCWVRQSRDLGDTAPGMGIRFKNIPPQAETILQEFSEQRAPLFFDV